MGSRKKLSLKQAEKMQARQAKKQSTTKKTGKAGKSGGSSGAAEKKAAGIILPNARSEKTVKEIKKLKVLTPYTVALRFDIRLSVARELLQELEQKGAIRWVSGSKNVKIYKPLD
ncbi:MAG: 40S ribosomal protein S25 [Candidatus Bathyarchaeota archaeon]|nr:40S ribosomal protein S25 [Candidatus Bathyarchaeota archaeon]MDH5732966.1 40S ribosomal protein S25 [Candidatus Bathyarchaeota archaeon]